MQFAVRWWDARPKPSSGSWHCADPGGGVDVDLTDGEDVPSCKVLVGYPGRRLGYHAIECTFCGSRVAVATDGGPDDPRSVRLPCRIVSEKAARPSDMQQTCK